MGLSKKYQVYTKGEKPNNFTGIDIFHLKANCVDECFLDCVRNPFLSSFVLGKPPEHKVYIQPRIKPNNLIKE